VGVAAIIGVVAWKAGTQHAVPATDVSGASGPNKPPSELPSAPPPPVVVESVKASEPAVSAEPVASTGRAVPPHARKKAAKTPAAAAKAPGGAAVDPLAERN
jgi:hypothetical protein